MAFTKVEAGSPPRADGAHGMTRPINPAIHRDLLEIDAIVGDLIDYFGQRGVQVVLLSEYGITNVDTPVHLNRIFREQGWLAVKDELGLEILDAGASRVFAVADHQVAHIYLNDRSLENAVRELLAKTPGIGEVLSDAGEGRRRHCASARRRFDRRGAGKRVVHLLLLAR